MTNPVTRLIIETEDRGASGTIQRIARELTGLGGAASAAGASGRVGADDMAAGLRRAALELAGVVTGYKALEVAKGFVSKGFKFNAELEQSRIGIASVITAVTDLTDAQGKTLTGMEKYTAAQAVAERSMKRIQIMGLETTATTNDLVAGFQSLIGPAAAVGMTLEQTEAFTMSMVQALGALGIPLNQLSAEGRSLLDGTIVPTQDRLAVALGITGEMVKNWRTQGRLVEELSKRLEPFRLAGKDVADTWGGLSSNMQDALNVLSAQTGRGIFGGVKQSYRMVMAELFDQTALQSGQITVGKDISNLADGVTRLNNALGTGVVDMTATFMGHLRDLNDPTTLLTLETSLANIANTGGRALSIVGGVGSAVGGLLMTTLNGWNSLPGVVQDIGIIGAVIGGAKARAVLVAIGLAIEGAQKIIDMGRDAAAVSSGNATLAQEIRTLEREIDAAQQDPNYYMSGTDRTIGEMQMRLASLKALRDQTKAAASESASAFNQDFSARDKAMDAAFAIKPLATVKGIPRESSAMSEAQKKKIHEATQSITRDLEQMNDTGTEGAGRIAALQKKMDDYAETLGKTNPKVKEYGDLIAYANQHNGFTPQQVAASTRAIEKETEALQDRADAIRQSTRADGTLDQSRLALLTAQSAARREYNQDLLKGVSEETAAAKRDLAMKAAQANAVQQDLAVRESFYSMLAGMYRNDEGLQRRLLDKQVENYRAAGVAEVDIARWKARRELEIATDAASGMKLALSDYYDGVSNMARVSGDATTTMVQGFETGIAGMLRNSESAWQNWQNTVLDVLANVAAKMLMLQAMNAFGMGESGGGSGMALGLGGAILNGIAGMFSPGGAAAAGATTLSNGAVVNASGVVWGMHDGGTVGRDATFSREVPMSLFAGARRYHGGGPVLSPGEVPIIAQTGERVQSRGEVAAMTASGGSILRALAEIREAVARQNWTNVNVTDKSLIYEAMATPQGRKILLNHVGAAPTEFRSALS